MQAAQVIKRKRDGDQLSAAEIQHFVDAYTSGQLPDYQMASLLMAICLRGCNSMETLALTKAMLESGEILDFSNLPLCKVDKHSTGGVGDKTTLILAPIAAACGVAVPMIAGRGLGHTGGTLDKLESIPGFSTQISTTQFKQGVEQYGLAIMGQTAQIAPADKKIYALRDVTGTVESLPLICASIMSKKLAEGIDALVLDVKYGNGAFMKSKAEAQALAEALLAINKGYGKKGCALLTSMNQPLGRYAGNSLEVEECVAILQGQESPLFADTRELSLQLAVRMLCFAKVAPDQTSAYAMAVKTLQNGSALAKFVQMCAWQGARWPQGLLVLPKASQQLTMKAQQSGFIQSFNTEAIGMIGIRLGAGRAVITDQIDPTAGIEFHHKIGAAIQVGQTLFTIYGSDLKILEKVSNDLLNCVEITANPTPPEPLIWKEIHD